MPDERRPTIDWEDVKARVARSGEALAGQARRDPGETLRKRARALAAPREALERAEQIEAVVFRLSGERFAIETAWLQEVFPATEVVQVPGTPPFVLGIVGLRAEVLSVVDLRRLFGLNEHGLSDMNRLLVLASGDMRFGVLADAVEGVGNIEREGLRKLPTLSGVREEHLIGVSPDGITVLDGARLLSDRSLIVYEKAE